MSECDKSIKWLILRQSLSPDPETNQHLILYGDERIDYELEANRHFEDLDRVESLGELGSEVAASAGFARRLNAGPPEYSQDFELDEAMEERIRREYQKDVEDQRKAKLN
jgi:hypothetical protein